MQTTVRACCRSPSCQACCKIVCAWLLLALFGTCLCCTVSILQIRVQIRLRSKCGYVHACAGESDGAPKRKRALEPEQRDVPAKAPKSQAGSQQPAMPPPPAVPLCKHGQLDLRICKNGAHKGRSFFCCRLPMGDKARCENAFIWLCDTPVGVQAAALAQTEGVEAGALASAPAATGTVSGNSCNIAPGNALARSEPVPHTQASRAIANVSQNMRQRVWAAAADVQEQRPFTVQGYEGTQVLRALREHRIGV